MILHCSKQISFKDNQDTGKEHSADKKNCKILKPTNTTRKYATIQIHHIHDKFPKDSPPSRMNVLVRICDDNMCINVQPIS